MPASADRLRQYDAAVKNLADAYADLGPLVAAGETQTAVQDTRLDDAIDSYVSESRQLFTETVKSDPRAALASLGGDFRVLAELAIVTEGPDLTAEDKDGTGLGGFAADMALVVAVAGGRGPGPAPMAEAGDGDPVASAVTSINAISTAGQAKLRAVVTAAVLPNVAELGVVVGALFGQAADEDFARVLAALNQWKDRIMRAATKLLLAVVNKVTAVLGGTAGDEIRSWLEDFLNPASIYEQALGVPRLRDRARRMLASAPDAADRAVEIAAVADRHEADQRWIGWAAAGLSWAGPKLRGMVPWGPPVVSLTAVALIAACLWLTEDHLDPYNVAWLPDWIRGVGRILA